MSADAETQDGREDRRSASPGKGRKDHDRNIDDGEGTVFEIVMQGEAEREYEPGGDSGRPVSKPESAL